MSNLEARLREILERRHCEACKLYHKELDNTTRYARQIIKVFEENGYLQFPKEGHEILYAYMTKGVQLYSGQTWYDRFEKELHGKGLLTNSVDELLGLVQEAAKRAAGIER